MTQITAGQVKELREKTGAGMMDCKKALVETAGDFEGAVDWLRKKGLAAAAKKAGRVAAEGLIGMALDGPRGALVEVNSETDFVARNEQFQAFVRTAAELALDAGGDVEALAQAGTPGGATLGEELTRLVGKIGENLILRRTAALSVDQGVVAGYVHNQVEPGLGKIGVLVALRSAGDAARLADLGRKLAMHVAAAAPAAIDKDGVDPALLQREREILAEQARASGKPEEIIAKMVEGRLRRYYEDVCLLEQTYVIDGETKVAKVLERAAKDLGGEVKVTAMARFLLGEGIERAAGDFAAEVAAQLS
ncbi:MAG TPA: translation elongation factor Ts [Kiloniellales bacterium]